MRRVVLLALLALALPMAAFANSIDFANQGGTITGSDTAGLTLSSTLIAVTGMSGCPCNGANIGSVSIQTGALTSGALGAGGTFGAGTITIMGNGTAGLPNGVLFSGSFTSATWTFEGTLANGTDQYTLRAILTNGQGFTVQAAVTTGKGFFSGTGDINSGDTNVVVPEPGTLGLLGTGLLGVAGLVRRKITL
jgi:hypothetical protein